MPFVYLLRCNNDSLYAGIAKDLAARVEQHEKGRGARYTRAHLPVSLVWSRRVRTWRQAMREERRIKRLRRSDKLALIAAGAAGTAKVRG